VVFVVVACDVWCLMCMVCDVWQRYKVRGVWCMVALCDLRCVVYYVQCVVSGAL